jgi:mRNA interferase RelE/StbE
MARARRSLWLQWRQNLAWQIEFDESAKKELTKLDRQVARRLIEFLKDRILSRKDPRSVGQALKGATLGEFWKYRVGDFRIIASIQDERMTVLVLRVGNRGDVYR